MEITVTCRHASITASVKAYAEEKVHRMTRIFDRLISAKVILDAEGVHQKAEAAIHAPTGDVLVAHASAGDWFEALDQLEHRLEGQVRRLKERVKNRRSETGGAARPVA